jgi:hypothetical protein
MTYSPLVVMLALILHALWRHNDPKGTAEWDDALSSVVAGIILLGLVAAVLALMFFVVAMGGGHH